MMPTKPSRFFLITLTAAIFLFLLVSCPWNRWTNGRLKDIDLLSSFMNRPRGASDSGISSGDLNIDPDVLALNQKQATSDSLETKNSDTIPMLPPDFRAPEKDGIILLEDYAAYGGGLERLKRTLMEARHRNVRIAMVGDSYIEGDIIAQDLRSGLQSRYGGGGVGYVGISSKFPGFRSSVNQASSGWEEVEIKKMKNDPLRTILGHYHIAKNGAEARFNGAVRPELVDHWERTRILFKASADGTISFSGADNMTEICNVSASDRLQEVSLSTDTKSIRITTDIPGLEVLGVWLENNCGIVLDDISLRGNSGLSHRQLNLTTTEEMRRWVDYDLIILEFGLNVVSTEQKNYSAYTKSMTEVVDNLKSLYPNAQILIMGVGDRATKINGNLQSMPTLPAMVKAQRELARCTGALFYDTRAAMGGDGAAINWNSRKLLNSDYVHLNHKGGRELAKILLQSVDTSLSNLSE